MIDVIRHLRRISKPMKGDRDLPVYPVWKTCMLPNEEIGRIFGMSYSAIRHILDFMRARIEKDTGLQAKFGYEDGHAVRF
jgi:hypothetical protein